MTAFIAPCPTPDLLLTTPTRGRYIVEAPEPTAPELLNRLARRLAESLPGPFNRRAELARHHALCQVQGFYNQARTLERLESLGFPATDAFLRH